MKYLTPEQLRDAATEAIVRRFSQAFVKKFDELLEQGLFLPEDATGSDPGIAKMVLLLVAETFDFDSPAATTTLNDIGLQQLERLRRGENIH